MTGVGFQPDVVFHAHGGHSLTAALPANIADGAFGLGVMDFDGDQWAFANWLEDAAGTSDTQRGQVTNAALYSFNQFQAVQKQASWVSMNADGFTLNFTNTGSAAAARVFSLALKGVNVKPGSFLKATAAAPAAQAITGVGFRPSLVMLASVQSTTPPLLPCTAGSGWARRTEPLKAARRSRIRTAPARRSSTPSTRPAKCS